MKNDMPAFIALASGTALAMIVFFAMPPGREREACCLVVFSFMAFYFGWRLRSRKGGE